MTLTGKLVPLVMRSSARKFDQAVLEPERTQEQKLLALMEQNKDTEYGKRHGFAAVKDIEEFQRRVPVVNYEDIAADMKRLVDGAKNVFTAEEPVMFARTSGTTGEPKFIPVTPTDYGREHKSIMRTWLYHSQHDHPGLFDGKIVTLVSPAEEGQTPSGIPYGSTSGHMYKNNPAIIKRMYSIPYPVFEIEDYHAKYYAIMRLSMEHDVTFLCTANPSSVLKMCEQGNENGEAIIKDICDGTLSHDVDISPEIRSELETSLKPNPERASFLEQARGRRDGMLKPADYWPNLALIGCWKGGTVGHYIDKFGDWLDPDGRRPIPLRDWGYLASEMRGSIPLSDEGSQGALTISSNFFEFVAVEEVDAHPKERDKWQFRTVGSIEDGHEYYVFVTTSSGLYRYDINDVVKVCGLYQHTPQIVFLRKGQGTTNLTGEKLNENQVIDAFKRAAGAAHISLSHFKAEADAENDRYIFRIESGKTVSKENALEFLHQADNLLKEINLEYKAKRDSMRLENPVLHVMRNGWHDHESRSKGGSREFQSKSAVLGTVQPETQDKHPDQKKNPDVEQVIELQGTQEKIAAH